MSTDSLSQVSERDVVAEARQACGSEQLAQFVGRSGLFDSPRRGSLADVSEFLQDSPARGVVFSGQRDSHVVSGVSVHARQSAHVSVSAIDGKGSR